MVLSGFVPVFPGVLPHLLLNRRGLHECFLLRYAVRPQNLRDRHPAGLVILVPYSAIEDSTGKGRNTVAVLKPLFEYILNFLVAVELHNLSEVTAPTLYPCRCALRYLRQLQFSVRLLDVRLDKFRHELVELFFEHCNELCLYSVVQLHFRPDVRCKGFEVYRLFNLPDDIICLVQKCLRNTVLHVLNVLDGLFRFSVALLLESVGEVAVCLFDVCVNGFNQRAAFQTHISSPPYPFASKGS